MRIDLAEQIGGLPAGKIRDFLRRSHGDGWGMEFVRRALRTDATTAERVVAALEASGFVTRIISCGEQVWQNTVRGNGFSQAIAAKPLWRETAEKRLDEFLARVAAVRTGDFAYKVKQVILFGSYLTSQERINDIDLCVSLAPKENDRAKQAAWERRRIEEAARHGRSFGTFLDRAGWPQDEVRYYLKARSRSLSLHGPDDGILKSCKHKVIYHDDA
jgi:predicted nucleotidyltransferase